MKAKYAQCLRAFAKILLFSYAVALSHMVHYEGSSHVARQDSVSQSAIPVHGKSCDSPSILIAVITFARPLSLQRLLDSLTVVNYQCATADLFISLDTEAGFPDSAVKLARRKVIDISVTHQWPHGSKFVIKRTSHVGLSRSWFELPTASTRDYIAIFEDDMEVSIHFYDFFSMVQASGALFDSNTTGFCLHPNDWELPVPKNCHSNRSSHYLYKSPEPCNWGPVWKMSAWNKFLDWVISMKDKGELPYVTNDIALNWNMYLDQGKDVQSSWVWKYNFLYNKVQVRYTFKTCDEGFSQEIYFTINHKEPGENFKRKLDLNNEAWRLRFDYASVKTVMTRTHAFQPADFPGYSKNLKSLRG